MHRLIGADPRHSQAFNVKFDGQLARSQSIDDELRLIANEFIHNDFYFAVWRPHVIEFVAMFSGRQIQLQPANEYGVDMFWSAQKLTDAKVKPKVCHTNDGLKAGLMIVRVSLAENSEARAGDLKSLHERDVKSVEFNPALKSCRQSFDDGGAQDWFGVRNSDGNSGENNDDRRRGNDADPAPKARVFQMRRVRFAFCQRLRPII